MPKSNTAKTVAKLSKSETPLPGKPVKGSESGRPIMAALNLLSRRWVLRIVWELKDGPCGFREMQARCNQLSPTTLSTRLSELEEAGIVTHTSDGAWTLTELGRNLKPALKALVIWSDEWAANIAEDQTP